MIDDFQQESTRLLAAVTQLELDLQKSDIMVAGNTAYLISKSFKFKRLGKPLVFLKLMLFARPSEPVQVLKNTKEWPQTGDWFELGNMTLDEVLVALGQTVAK